MNQTMLFFEANANRHGDHKDGLAITVLNSAFGEHATLALGSAPHSHIFAGGGVLHVLV